MNTSAPQTCQHRAQQLMPVFNASAPIASNATTPNPDATIKWAAHTTDEMPGVRFDSTEFVNNCGAGAGFYKIPTDFPQQVSVTNASSYMVVNVTSVTRSGSPSSTALRFVASNCNGSESFNATTAGVFVLHAPEIVVYVERVSLNATPPRCQGTERVEYIVAPLEAYCKVYTTLPDCQAFEKKAAPSVSSSVAPSAAPSTSPAPASSAASSIKRSVTMLLASVCMVLAAVSC